MEVGVVGCRKHCCEARKGWVNNKSDYNEDQ